MAASPCITTQFIAIDDTTRRGLVVYEGSNCKSPLMPSMPAFSDTPTDHKFYTNITGLSTKSNPHLNPCPRSVDKHLFMIFGLNLASCPQITTCLGPFGSRLSASMNSESFVLPGGGMSLLEAFFKGASGIYTTDFPDKPLVEFDYTNQSISVDKSFFYAPKSTKVRKLKFNSTVEIVLQNTFLVGIENHPIHIHGFNFYVLAQGFGNYNPTRDEAKFNLVNPQMRNTIAVPVDGWVVIRFRANNPGIWLVHCHIDAHLPWGMTMAFEIENGSTPSSILPPPPADLQSVNCLCSWSLQEFVNQWLISFSGYYLDSQNDEETQSERVKNLTVERLCNRHVITAVNGSYAGPTIRVNEGDTLVVHVLNNSPHNITIHWHGIFQLLSGWADGPAYVTQCAIRPKHSYTYRFTITGQEGTLWWHAHSSVLRATVYGALLIRPR
ncbi:hypothetical protein L6164_003454 [Bauhinia variegata]|uniref:Uncharacterized protein n=1 Tax=Bauhinia variegata TaxID=167791 RepID=A0ACB9Q6V0_BAUVA|nr:hypothetical protein L6164_003454 [Bauhinia variegata]